MISTVAEVLGVIFSLLFFFSERVVIKTWSVANLASLSIFFLLYLFIRTCASLRWYRNASLTRLFGQSHKGIELHFKRMLLATSILLLFASTILYFFSSAVGIWVGLFPLLFMSTVNGIILYLHFKDKDPLPVNYFSHGKSLTRHVKLGTGQDEEGRLG